MGLSGNGVGNCPKIIFCVGNPQVTTRNGKAEPWLGEFFSGSNEGGVIDVTTINHNMVIIDK